MDRMSLKIAHNLYLPYPSRAPFTVILPFDAVWIIRLRKYQQIYYSTNYKMDDSKVLCNWVAVMESLARSSAALWSRCELVKQLAWFWLNFPFSNKDKTVGECRQVVLQSVSPDERQEESAKASRGTGCIISLQPQEELFLIAIFPFIRRYLREASRRLVCTPYYSSVATFNSWTI
jgi:hypothetical protein